MKKKTVGDFLKAQDCLFIKRKVNNKVYFCEFFTASVAWNGKPVIVGIKFKRKCIVTELDETTVIDYSADTLYEDKLYTDDWAIAIWENTHGIRADEYIDSAARDECKLACEEE